MKGQYTLYRGRREKPPPQPTFPGDGRPAREPSSISSCDGTFGEQKDYAPRPQQNYSQSINVPVTTREEWNTQRSYSTPNVSESSNFTQAVPYRRPFQSYRYAGNTTGANEFGTVDYCSQVASSPVEAPVYANPIESSSAIHTNDGNSSGSRHSLQQNSRHPLYQPWDRSAGRFTPSQGTENTGIAESSSNGPMLRSKTWDASGDEGPQVCLDSELYESPWSDGDSRPLQEKSINSSYGSHHDDSVSPRSSGIAYSGYENFNGNAFPRPDYEGNFSNSGEFSYQPRYGTNPTKSDEHQSVQSSEEQPQAFDLGIKFNALQVDDGGESLTGNYSKWSQDSLRAGRSMNYIDSATSTYSKPCSSDSEDDETFRPRLPYQPERDLNIGTNLVLSLQRYKDQEDVNAFQCDVHVWQDSLPPNPKQVQFVTLLFDTQCEGSNWVAATIVDQLGAEIRSLPRPAEFIGFNGELMTTSLQTTLSFKNSSGGAICKADFLVSPVAEVPFDMLLGARDCLRLKIIARPRLLGLARSKQSKGEKEQQAARIAQHALDVAAHNRRVQEMKRGEEKRKMKMKKHK